MLGFFELVVNGLFLGGRKIGEGEIGGHMIVDTARLGARATRGFYKIRYIAEKDNQNGMYWTLSARWLL